ncbi:hypothetical protein FOS14_04015 [Skermania sp. ID1734]|uniref:hypothetical protein n=1 Tax=Skermania sp. ID1734 TaxID=2597516 RepID=UPI00117F2227|nr:hypothetical protein [Skermania sp. ID1734]TSE00945.1 hypothetical protein FOS14_04015 [Skermania sp. ID1734]
MSEPAGFAGAQDVGNAVLYEGYLLYPYRKSSGKNRVRWQFGILAPRDWLSPEAAADSSVSGSADTWYQQTECLFEAPDDAIVHVRVRFLQVQQRRVEAAGTDGSFAPVDEIDTGQQRYLSFDEAVPQQFDVVATLAQLRAGPHEEILTAPAGEEFEPIGAAGRIVRTRQKVSAVVRLSLHRAEAPFRLRLLRVVIENDCVGIDPDLPRQRALARSLVSTHALIGVLGGRMLSLLDPPEWAASAAKACRNIHAFPVLTGDRGRADTVLSSPILLYDHPAVSPESPGDLFDATEIDEILSLRTLTLTDAEKAEARATDPRAAAIIDRVDGIPSAVFERLHGAVRSLQRVDPASEAVYVNGVAVAKGARVQLKPRTHGTDVHDIFLAGRTATVAEVKLDVDGTRFLAVTLDDDPGADLHEWYGRFYYFTPEEVVPVSAGGEPEI